MYRFHSHINSSGMIYYPFFNCAFGSELVVGGSPAAFPLTLNYFRASLGSCFCIFLCFRARSWTSRSLQHEHLEQRVWNFACASACASQKLLQFLKRSVTNFTKYLLLLSKAIELVLPAWMVSVKLKLYFWRFRNSSAEFISYVGNKYSLGKSFAFKLTCLSVSYFTVTVAMKLVAISSRYISFE